MFESAVEPPSKSRLACLLDHFGAISDPRDPRYVAHPLREIMFLVVCGSICDGDDFDLIADWGEAHLEFLRRFLPYHHAVPCGRWLNIMINRIGPALFQEAFTAWVRETWPERPGLIAIDGKTSRRSHDHAGAPTLGRPVMIEANDGRADETKRPAGGSIRSTARHPREQARKHFPSRDFH